MPTAIDRQLEVLDERRRSVSPQLSLTQSQQKVPFSRTHVLPLPKSGMTGSPAASGSAVTSPERGRRAGR